MPPALATDPILKRFRAALDETYGDRLERVVLFGSRARGDAGEDSETPTCLFIAKKVYCLVQWSFSFVNAEAKAELDALPADMRASFERIVQLVQAVGLERVHEPYIKHIEDRLWEMRLRGRGGIARSLYVTASGRRVVILRTFAKRRRRRRAAKSSWLANEPGR